MAVVWQPDDARPLSYVVPLSSRKDLLVVTRSLHRPAARRSLLGAVGLTTALLLSGCGQSHVQPGAAALVGNDRIGTDALQQVVNRGLADPQALQQLGGDRVAFQRQALARLINRQVLQRAAADRNLTVTQGEIDAQLAQFAAQAGGQPQLLQQAAQGGIAAQDLPDFVRDIVLEQKLGDALTADVTVPEAQLRSLYQQNIGQYQKARSRHILVKDEKTARAILARVQPDPSRFAALAAQFSTDSSNKDKGGELGLQPRGTFVPAFEKVLYNAPVGSYSVVQTQFGWHVVNVEDRQITAFEQAVPELRRAALQKQRQAAIQKQLAASGASLGIDVNPRFGDWDPKTGTVVAGGVANGVVSPAPSGGTGAPGAPARPGVPGVPAQPAPSSAT